ncbi:DEDD exonuclease domain-containing protein [Natronosporangium hydrolyticum]|uniref:DEDD exonuclease domain-containing protein n=1 Tax=Natronosporangium hydrolyticum TaxID=2811111 RepID=UPI001EFA27C9|nr:DEDD exonuclease domain-containing protein [Natronosporangium hydrolyticum]
MELHEVTFTVVDLETTGGAPDGGGIVEVGAVKVRGGAQLGQLNTLVDPGTGLPPMITALTGLTPQALRGAPPLPAVLPSLLELLAGSVFVAHNAPYDVGFLKAACRAHDYRWPAPVVVDTAALARRVLHADEVPDRKLATLARHFGTSVQPRHRAFDDALATVEVLHALIGRLAGHGVYTLRDTVEFVKAVHPVQRRKRSLAEGLPHRPGVYLFRGADHKVLYVGTSGDIQTRVRSYFTAAERRGRIREMLGAADRVEAVECAHALEAQVRELRLIEAHRPPYNRRSRDPGRVWWLKLTDEAYPRLSMVRTVAADRATYLGPYRTRRAAETVATAVYDAVPLRQCTARLSPRRPSTACALAELGRCPAPCQLAVSPPEYAAQVVAPVRDAFVGDPGQLVTALRRRLTSLAEQSRYETAAQVRARLTALLRSCIRQQRRAGLIRIGELCAARPAGDGWELVVVRHGRLAGAGYARPGIPPREVLAAVHATAETVAPGPAGAATAEETDRVLDWLEQPETRLVEVSEGWASPLGGAARFAGLLAQLEQAARRG